MILSAQKRSLYVFSWQLLRVNLNFTTVESTQKSIDQCAEYLQVHGKTVANLYKVINLYAATAMGLNGQLSRNRELVKKLVLRDILELVQEARQPLSETYAGMHKFSEDFLVLDVERRAEITNARDYELYDVHLDLSKRWLNAQKRTYEVKRDELLEYLHMLEYEMNFRGNTYTPVLKAAAKRLHRSST